MAVTIDGVSETWREAMLKTWRLSGQYLENGNFCLVASPHLEGVYHGVRVICREDPGGTGQGD